jgi:nucleotide-binding universal stress UspA family protein
LFAALPRIAAPRLASMPRRGIAAQLQYFCEPLFDFFAADPALSRALFKGMMFYADPVAKARRDAHVADFLRVLVGLFEDAKLRGELAPRADPRICAHNVFAIYVDAITAFVTADEPDRAALGTSFQERIGLLLRGSLARSLARTTPVGVTTSHGRSAAAGMVGAVGSQKRREPRSCQGLRENAGTDRWRGLREFVRRGRSPFARSRHYGQ